MSESIDTPPAPPDLSERSRQLWPVFYEKSKWKKGSDLSVQQRIELLTRCLQAYDKSQTAVGADRAQASKEFLDFEVTLGLLAER